MTSKEITEAVRRYHERQATRMDQRTSELERAIIRYRARRSARIALKNLESLKNTDGKSLDTEFSSDKIQLPLKSDGGPGSGNFGHKGVPGQLGGSAPPGPKKELEEAIVTGRVSTKLDRKKQSKHTKGTAAYNKAVKAGQKVSVMTISDDDVQGLVSRYSGKGHIRIVKGQIRETFEHTSTIGTYVGRTGESFETTRGTIHYSKTGTHVVPSLPVGKGRKK
jgi:hypothetical protein